jgi:hypothetical protein
VDVRVRERVTADRLRVEPDIPVRARQGHVD